MSTATVVTAYYRLSKNKYTLRAPITKDSYDKKNPYSTWLKKLFSLKANIIFFTDKATYESTLKLLIEESKKENITIQFLEQCDFYATSQLGVDWNTQYRLDREREIHSTEVYKVWTQKVDFVRRAMDIPYYKSNIYAWVDAGCFRGYYEYDYVYATFPSTRRVVPGKIMVNVITNLRDEEKALRKLHMDGGFVPNLRRDVFPATCMLGDRSAWTQFHDVYYTTVKRYYDNGFFVGREETIYTKCLIIYPELFQTYRNVSSNIKEVLQDIANMSHWHYFKLYFSEETDDTLLPVTG